MSETFYIKKTAFDDNNFDLTQREAESFIIGPGELNGPGGIARNSDLELYGFGAIKWGEGVDQNQYRQLENFACPAKETNDFKVGTDDPVDYVPGTGSFNATTDPITPKDENDLGIGNGITSPLEGQNWYNTTDKTMYVFGTGSPVEEWRSVMVSTNTLDMNGYGIINLLDPDFAATTLPGSVTTINKQDALTVGWSDLRYVNQTGDDMVGTLTITDTLALDLTGNMTIIGDTTQTGNMDLTGTMTIITAATLALDITGDTTMSGNLNLTDSSILSLGNDDDLSLTHNGTFATITNTTGSLTIENSIDRIHINALEANSQIIARASSNTICLVLGGADKSATLYFEGNQKLKTSDTGITTYGQVTVTDLAPTIDSHLARKDYIDDNFVADAGGVMDSTANITFQGGGEVLGLPTIPSATGAASKEYVDDNISSATIIDYIVGTVREASFEPDSITNAAVGVWTYTGNLHMARDGTVRIRFMLLSIDVNNVSEWEIRNNGILVASGSYSSAAASGYFIEDIAVFQGDLITVGSRAIHGAVAGVLAMTEIEFYVGNSVVSGYSYT